MTQEAFLRCDSINLNICFGPPRIPEMRVLAFRILDDRRDATVGSIGLVNERFAVLIAAEFSGQIEAAA